MKQKISDLEELVLHCESSQSKEYIAEAVACYNGGAYRACIVSTWISVVFDFVGKLHTLELAGDKAAKDRLEEFNEIREQADVARSLKFERNILDWALNQFELISPLEYQDLCRLVEDRHRCAHPSMSSADELYQPSAELARCHVRNAVEYLLQHPPVQGKAALAKIIGEVDGVLFPTQKQAAVQHFRFGPLAKPRPALVRNLLIVLMKQFLTEALDENALLRRAAAINATRDMHRMHTEQTLQEKLNELARAVGDNELLRLVMFLGLVEDCWGFLDPDVIGRLQRYSEKVPQQEVAKALPVLLRIPALEARAKARIATLNTEQLSSLASQVTPTAEMLDRAVTLYSSSGLFDTANTRADSLIIPLAPSFKQEQVARIVEAACTNSQIYGSFRCVPALERLRDQNPNVTPEAWDELLAKFDNANWFDKLRIVPPQSQSQEVSEVQLPSIDEDIPL